jgi:predicted AlkP superfamily phosphohydrolase/phosphomutase
VIGLLPLLACLLLTITPRRQEKYLQTRPKLASWLHGSALRGAIVLRYRSHPPGRRKGLMLAGSESTRRWINGCGPPEISTKMQRTWTSSKMELSNRNQSMLGLSKRHVWLREPLEALETVIKYLLTSGYIGNAVEMVRTLLRIYAVASYFGKIHPHIPGSYEEYCTATPNFQAELDSLVFANLEALQVRLSIASKRYARRLQTNYDLRR